MASINDLQYEYLRSLGYDEELSEMFRRWFWEALGGPDLPYERNEVERDLFISIGYPGSAINEMWYAFITDQGYSDLYEYWAALAAGNAQPPTFSGLIAYYPLANNARNLASVGRMQVVRLSPKNFADGNGVTTVTDNIAAIGSHPYRLPTSVDNDVQSGNYVSGNFIGGVDSTTYPATILIATDLGSPASKYAGQFNSSADIVGTTLTARNGAEVTVISADANGTLDGIATGGTVQEIKDGFEYPAAWALDLSTSSYTKQEIIDIREAVGDNVSDTQFAAGVSLEGADTNLITYSQDFSNPAWNPAPSVTVTGGQSAPDGSNTAYLIDGLSSNTTVEELRIAVLSGVNLNGRTFTGNFHIKANGNAGDTIKVRMKRTAGTALSVDVSHQLTDDWKRTDDCVFTGIADTSGLSMVLFSQVGTTTASSCYIWQADVTESSTSSSPIYTSGSSATRNADKATIATSDAFVDEQCFLADRQDGTFSGGVNTTLKQFGFFDPDPPTMNGKYVNAVTSDWVGAVLTASNGAKVSVTTAPFSSVITYTTLSGTDAEIQAGFEYPNTFEVDFSTSTYTSPEVKVLRLSAEYTGDLNVDTDAKLCSYDNGQYVGGIYTAAKFLWFGKDGAFGLDGTYPQQFTFPIDDKNAWPGAVFTAGNGAQILIASRSAGSNDQLGFSVLSGTDPEVQAGFEYPNSFEIDFTNSTLTPTQLLQTRSTDTSLWTDWPTDNFKLSFDALFREEGASGSTLLESAGFKVYQNATGELQLSVGSPAVLVSKVGIPDSVTNTETSITIERTGGNYTLTAFGNSNTVASVSAVLWGNYAQVSSDLLNANHWDSVISEIKVEPI